MNKKTKERLKKNTGTPNKLDELVSSTIGNIAQDFKTLQVEYSEIEEEYSELEETDRRYCLHDQIREAALELNVIPEAMEDVLLNADIVFSLGENGKAQTEEGITPLAWLNNMQSKRSIWWPQSQGGGSTGNGRLATASMENPWSAKHWNVTKTG